MHSAGIKRPIVGTPFEWETGERNGKPNAINLEILKPFKPKIESDDEDGDDGDDQRSDEQCFPKFLTN